MVSQQLIQSGLDFSLSHPIICTTAIIALYAIYCALHNRYSHPLRHFPGPILGGMTDFHHTCLFASKKVHIKLLNLHEKYGSYVRVAPNLLSISDPLLLPKIYHRHAEKTPFYSTGMAGEQAPLLQVQDDLEHAIKLRTLGPTYSLRHIRQLEWAVDEQIIRTLRVFETRFGNTRQPLDIAEYTRWHVYDTITQLIYGKPIGMVEQGRDVNGLIRQWHKIFTLGGLVATLPWLVHPIISAPILRNVFMPHKGNRYGSGYIMSEHEKLFAHRLNNAHLARPGNLMDSLRRARNTEGDIMSDSEAEHECFILTVGSQDTSAAFISAFIDFLLRHDKARNQLLDEIAEGEKQCTLSSPVATYDETASMIYFMACVYETLRLSPSVSMSLPRFTPKEGIFLGDTWIPGGVELAANPYIIHRDTAIFGEDAKDFRPERWIDSPKAQLRLMRKYFLAFGYGSRRCLGKNIALFESQKFLIQLFRDFEIQYWNPEKPYRTQNWGINMYWEQYLSIRPIGTREGSAS